MDVLILMINQINSFFQKTNRHFHSLRSMKCNLRIQADVDSKIRGVGDPHNTRAPSTPIFLHGSSLYAEILPSDNGCR